MRVFMHLATHQQTINALLYLSWSIYYSIFVSQSIFYLSALQHQKSTLVSVIHRCLNLPHNKTLINRFYQLLEQINCRAPHITFYLFELHPIIYVQVDHQLIRLVLFSNLVIIRFVGLR